MPTLTVSILCTYCTHFNTFTLRPTLTGRESIARGHWRPPQLPALRVVGADSGHLLDLRSVAVDALRTAARMFTWSSVGQCAAWAAVDCAMGCATSCMMARKAS